MCSRGHSGGRVWFIVYLIVFPNYQLEVFTILISPNHDFPRKSFLILYFNGEGVQPQDWKINNVGDEELVISSANFCDDLLVEADFFIILGVSFFVTQNALNFIEKKEHRGTVQKVFYSSMSHLLNWWGFWFRSRHTIFLIATAQRNFWWMLAEIIFHKNCIVY